MNNKDQMIMSGFAKGIMEHKYSHNLSNGTKESWENIAYRVTKATMRAAGYTMRDSLCKEIFQIIKLRKFIPGGRYLYACGRPFHQVQNCLLLEAEDSREGWSDLMYRAAMALMTGAGIGVDYSSVRPEGKSIRKTGGKATGPLALIGIINEAGRRIMQGGSRRSAIWAGLNWNHADIHNFITSKNWNKHELAGKKDNFNYPATFDMTNISVLLDDLFFEAYHDDKHILHSRAHDVYWSTVRQMLKTAEPGFSIDIKENKGETLRNACVVSDTMVMTSKGYFKIGKLLNKEVEVWNGEEFSKVTIKHTGRKNVFEVELSDGSNLICSGNHEFIKENGDKIECENLLEDMALKKFDYPTIDSSDQISPLMYWSDNSAYSQGFYSGDGNKDRTWSWVYSPKEKCIPKLIGKITKCKGYDKYRWIHGIMYDKSFVPMNASLIHKIEWLAGLLDADGTLARTSKTIQIQLGSIDYTFLLNVKLLLSTLGVSCTISKMRDEGFADLPDGKGSLKKYLQKTMYRLHLAHNSAILLKSLGLRTYRLAINEIVSITKSNNRRKLRVKSVINLNMLENTYCFNEPKKHRGCFNGIITGQCTEVVSNDDNDICNLGSINLARIDSMEEMSKVVELSTIFLLAGTIYSSVPYPKVDSIRTKNRRLGLGLMGIHEWLIKNRFKYKTPIDKIAHPLTKYLESYTQSTAIAHDWCKKWDISPSVKTRAIAPTGSIGILGETTTGIEPMLCTSYIRRYLKGDKWCYKYVIEPIAKYCKEELGVDPDALEDAYSLAESPETRVAFQAWIQQYVDHGISSTINLPRWGSQFNNETTVHPFGDMLIKYLPKLRGITCYPDGARDGQPLVPVDWSTAIGHLGKELIEEQEDICSLTKGGSCGE